MNTEVLSNSPDDTYQVGVVLGSQLKGNEIILLEGDLGTGKTVLTKGIAQALGIDAENVVSPTFTLINEFRGEKGIHLYHIDLYRLGPSIDDGLPEIDDYIDNGVIIIEWAQFLDPAYFNMNHVIQVRFHLIPENDNQRKIEIHSTSPLTI